MASLIQETGQQLASTAQTEISILCLALASIASGIAAVSNKIRNGAFFYPFTHPDLQKMSPQDRTELGNRALQGNSTAFRQILESSGNIEISVTDAGPAGPRKTYPGNGQLKQKPIV